MQSKVKLALHLMNPYFCPVVQTVFCQTDQPKKVGFSESLKMGKLRFIFDIYVKLGRFRTFSYIKKKLIVTNLNFLMKTYKYMKII